MTPLQKLKKSLDRHDYYGAIPDDAQVYISRHGDNLYELIPEEENTPLTLGDLREIVKGVEP